MTHAKYILFSLFVFVFGACFNQGICQPMQELPPNQLVFPDKNYKIDFKWLGDSVGNRWERRSALLLPVKLPNCSKAFYMQLDTGSPSSLFYGGKLDAINRKYPVVDESLGRRSKLSNYRFLVGKMAVVAKEIEVKEFGDSTINWSKGSVEIIGTLGSDFIDGRTIIINYPKQKLTLNNKPDEKLSSKFALEDFMYARRSILFPAKVRNKRILLFFDTGSSAYELLTDKKTAESLSMPNTQVVQATTKSWNRMMTSNTVETSDSIQVGSQLLPIGHATYMEGVSDSQLSQMMKLGIGGMTGNKLFANAVLLIDTRNKKFGLSLN